MNFNILFTLLSTLSFTLHFDNTPDQRQDFFIFDGENSTAHLFRENRTLILYIRQSENYTIYRYVNVSDKFAFTWDGYRVNKREMTEFESNGNISNNNNMTFIGYTILSPITFNHDDLACDYVAEKVYQPSKMNYGYLILIVFVIAVLMKSDKIAVRIYKAIADSQKTENEYVNMGVPPPDNVWDQTNNLSI